MSTQYYSVSQSVQTTSAGNSPTRKILKPIKQQRSTTLQSIKII